MAPRRVPTIWWLLIDITSRKYSAQQRLKEPKYPLQETFFFKKKKNSLKKMHNIGYADRIQYCKKS